MNKDIDYLKKYLPKDKLDDGLRKLRKGISPQYIVGNVDFMGNIINVDKRVLIPRFETELLVEKTIDYINKMFLNKVKILDLCTGSGCIAISIKKKIDCEMIASDLSTDALDVAKSNIRLNKVDISLINSDLFDNINDKFDVIVCNPPYISYDEDIDDLVKNNEPEMALYALDKGLFFYKEILSKCINYLNNKFLIAFEIGFTQGESIKQLVYKYLGTNVYVNIEKDYSDRDRYVFIWK